VRALAGVALLLLGMPALAQSQDTDIRGVGERVVGEALLEAYLGVTHEGAYNFDAGGRAGARYTETHNPDGTTDYAEEGETMTGAWVILGKGGEERLCFQYPVQPGGCFRVWRVANCFYYYSDSLPERADEVEREYWTARSVKRGEDASCAALFS